MNPIKLPYTLHSNGTKLLNLTLDPFCFLFNSLAMGDMVAAAPVVKYMVERYYTDPASYMVVAKQAFRPLFPFVPDDRFKDFDNKDEVFWGIPEGFAAGLFLKKSEGKFVRSTPKHMHLSHFASIAMTDRIIPLEHLNYVPLNPVDVSKFDINFSKAVILVTSYRDITRAWHADHILGVAEWLKKNGMIPVFIGKTDMDLDAKRKEIIPKNSLPNDISEYGVDLRNQTTIPELASIFAKSKAICGLDSGPIHLAGTTSIPIVCGYTSVSPEFRIPTRKKGKTYPITPKIECIGCESRWRSNYWNYENCYFGHINCCEQMTADKFIAVLKNIK